MIKNLLWKQAMKLAKKKFGDLNTNEANKWLVDKYNALLGKENTKNIANKIREDLKRDRPFEGFDPKVVENDPFKNLRGNESFDELLELGGNKIKKFNPFKKEGKKIDFMDYYSKRKRGEFDEGGKVYSAEDINSRLKILKEVRQGLAPSSYLYLRDELVKDALASGLISEEDYFNKWQKPFFGERGEKWTDAIDSYEQRNFNEGGFTGSNLYFQDKHGEYDFSTRYNMMSPKEGFDQLIQDYINSTKMEEGELGKLPPIPLSALRAGLGYLLKQLAGGKFNQERRDVLEFFTKPGKPTELTNKIKYSRVKKKSDDLNKKIAEEMSKYATKHAEGGLAGMLGETQPQQVGLAQDREVLIRELYDAAGGFDGTGKTFSEFMADVIYEGDYIYAKGGRVGLKKGGPPFYIFPEGLEWMQELLDEMDEEKRRREGFDTLEDWNPKDPTYHAQGGRVGLKDGGMTPSEKWMRNYYFDGKGGYDTWMSFQEFMTGPGIDLWYKHIGKKDGGRAGYLKGGLLRQGIMEALDFFTRKGSRQGVDVRETILPADDVGDYAVNMGEVRNLFKNLDEKFANKITSKESIDDIITRFRDTRKLDLSESIKEFLNNRIKQYKSGLENIKKYGQMGPIEEVGDHAEELRYLIKETRKDLDAIDKYGVTQQSKKATKHAEGGIIGLKDGGLLEKYEKYSPKGPWTKGLWNMDVVYTLHDLLAPLFMKEGGRVGFSKGKGPKNPGRRKFMKIAGGIASILPFGIGKIFKLAKPATDFTVKLRTKWLNSDVDYGTSGLAHFDISALTPKVKKVLYGLMKNKEAVKPGLKGKDYSMIEPGDAKQVIKKLQDAGFKGKITGIVDEGGDVLQQAKKGGWKNFVDDFKKSSMRKNIAEHKRHENFVVYENDPGFMNWRKNTKGQYDPYVSTIDEVVDLLEPVTKKAEGGRVGLYKGGIIDLLIKGGKFLNKNSPVELYKKYLKSVKDRTLKANETGKFTDMPLEVIPIASAGALVTNYLKKKLKSLDEQTEEKAEGGRIGLDAGGPPISPANLHPLQRPMFYQGGLTKTVPPQRGPMPQGLQSDVYDGIMRPGVINGRN